MFGLVVAIFVYYYIIFVDWNIIFILIFYILIRENLIIRLRLKTYFDGNFMLYLFFKKYIL